MHRFNLYICWEITKLFVIALVAFTTVIMLAGIAKELLTQGLGLFAVLELLPFVLPESLQFALPATLLFSVCSIYGRISADNEVLAVTSSGVPPIKIIKPVLIASFLISLFAVWMNDLAVSWGRPGINRVVMHSVEQVVYAYLAREGSYSAPKGFSIHVHRIGEDGRELQMPTINIPMQSGPPLEISAKSARLQMDPVEEVLRIELEESELTGEQFQGMIPGKESYEVLLTDATRKGTSSGNARDFPLRELGKEKRKQREDISRLQEEIATRAAMGMATGRFDWTNDEVAMTALGQMDGGFSRVTRLAVEPWRRWALGFTCLLFVWVGIPLSIWMRSADHWTSFGVVFLPILLVFFPVFAIGLENAKDGQWPPISVWLGNLVLLICGAYWLRRVYRS